MRDSSDVVMVLLLVRFVQFLTGRCAYLLLVENIFLSLHIPLVLVYPDNSTNGCISHGQGGLA